MGMFFLGVGVTLSMELILIVLFCLYAGRAEKKCREDSEEE